MVPASIKVIAPKAANPFGFPHFELIHQGFNRVLPVDEVVEVALVATKGHEWQNELRASVGDAKTGKLFAADKATAEWAGIPFDASVLPKPKKGE